MLTDRRSFALLALLLGACKSAPPKAIDFPPALKGGWRLTNVDKDPDAPEEIRALGLARSYRARYEDEKNRELNVHVFVMTTSAGALEMQQKAIPEPGKLTFNADQHYVELTGAAASRDVLSEASKEIEAKLPK